MSRQNPSSSGTDNTSNFGAELQSRSENGQRRASSRMLLLFQRSEAFRLQFLRLFILIAFLAGWQLSVDQGWINKLFVSTPSDVATFLWKSAISGELWTNMLVTFREALLGFLIGASLGVTVGLLLSHYHLAGQAVDPYLTFVNAIPRVALAPLFLLWFGLREASKFALAASIVFFVLEVITRSAVAMVDRDLVTIAKLMGANNRQTFVRVILPSIVPAIFGGIRLGIVYALLGAVLGEMLAAQSGLGQQLTLSAGLFQTNAVIGLLFVMGLLAATVATIMTWIERRLLRWRDSADQGRHGALV
jgi:NitT/TauT family transport system permease protein